MRIRFVKALSPGDENGRISVIGFQIECLFLTNNSRGRSKKAKQKTTAAAKTPMESGSKTVENMQIAVGS